MTRPREWPEWLQWWFGPVNPIRLETFRMLFSVSLLVFMLAWWQHAEEWLTPTGFHPSREALRSFTLVFPPLPRPLLPWFGVVLFGSITALVVGEKTRLMRWLVFLCITYVTCVDPLSSFTLNRLYIASFALLALSAEGAYWNVDGTRPRPRSAWALRMLQATFITQVFTAGICKITWGQWLDDPYILWSQAQGHYKTPLAAWMYQHVPVGMWAWMQYSALSFELLCPLLFVVRALRPIGFLWGFAFFMLIALTMHELIYFSFQLLSFFVLFVDDEILHGIRRRVRRRVRRLMIPLRRWGTEAGR